MTAQSGLTSDRWYFTEDEIANSPSFKQGIPNSKETSYRQHAALLIQEMGQRLKVNQLCINTGIVYMHRFFTCHPFRQFNRNRIAKACIFLSAKVEEQPRKLEHVINTAHFILTTGTQPLSKTYTPLDPHGEEYKRDVEELIRNETIILQTLGFEVTVDHPHTHVVRAVQQLKVLNGPTNENGSGGYLNDLAKSSYFMATESLHLSTFCLQYKPSLVAAVCVHIACKWAKYEIDHPDPNSDWWELLGPDISLESLNEIAGEFVRILEITPTKLKKMLHHTPHNSTKHLMISGRKGETLKRPRTSDEHRASYQPHPEPRSAMEKSVSDKLDILIGSSKTKPSNNNVREHGRKEDPNRRTNHEHSKNHPEIKRPVPRPPDQDRKPPAASDIKYHDKHDVRNSKPALKKPRVDSNHHHRTNEQLKKLEHRMKIEQLEHTMQKSNHQKHVEESPPPPPPPPPPPLQRAPVAQISSLRYNMPPPPLHNMPRQTDMKRRHPG